MPVEFNYHGSHLQALRAAILGSITPEDVKAISAKLIADAREGNTAAARTLFDVIGLPSAADEQR